MLRTVPRPRPHRRARRSGLRRLWWPRRASRDAGISLLEVLIAATLLASSVIVTVSVIEGASSSGASGDRRTAATNLAQREIESMRATRYDQLGFLSSAAGYVSTFEGRPTVSLAAGAAFTPTASDTAAGTTFAIRRHITYGTATVGVTTDAQAYKQLTVIVTWTESGGTRTVRQDSAVNPRLAYLCATPTTDAAPGGGLTGVVNTYYPGVGAVGAGATSITVGTSTGAVTPIAAGDLLLVIQMQDASINSTNTDAYGDGTSGAPDSGATQWGASGRYEYVMATSAVATNVVTITGAGADGGLTNSYVSAAATATSGQRTFQVIRVPTYPSVSLASGLTASAWNGSSGGVLAVDVAGTLTLGSQSINVDGLGFRGAGNPRIGGGATNSSRVLANSNAGAPKGEGTAGTPRWIATAVGMTDLGSTGYPGGDLNRGAPANAGGGGNSHNAGGGGGGNGGAGGKGGFEWNTITDLGGFGGSVAPWTTSRLFLGGGGGAGDANDTAAPKHNGGPGGGLVLIRATTLSGTGSISAKGGAGQPTAPSWPDGGGGGGAGGTVVVSATAGIENLSIDASGGRGGAMYGDRVDGAGGGGGVVLTTGATASTVVGGGQPGQLDTGSSSTATSGSLGTARQIADTDLVGIPLGVGCQPRVTVTKTTSTTPVILGGQATYTITVANAAGRATATALSITDPLPAGLTYSTTSTVSLNGGATRTANVNPTAGATAPAWGTFTIPGGGSVAVTFSADVPVSATIGTASNSVFAAYTGLSSSAAAMFDGASSSAEDVLVTSYPCATPYTDAATSISGVVNSYYPGTTSAAAGATRIAVGSAASGGSASAIAAGDLLLVLQMQDATFNYTDTSSYGDGVAGVPVSGVTSWGGSGLYEYAVATSAVSGGYVGISGRGTNGGLVNSYTNAASSGTAGTKRFQVVRVPTYNNVTLSGTVSALAWNGTAGGVVAMDVTGTITMNGQTISAQGTGFRGAAGLVNGTIADSSVYASATTMGRKGEGAGGTPRYTAQAAPNTDNGATTAYPGGDNARGAPANAGGGGNMSNSGGGGGGNAGAGGTGGATWSSNLAVGGYGGGTPTNAVTRVLMGGGGGSGDENDHTTPWSDGGSGGGIVVLRALSISGAGTINANGATGVGSVSVNDGGGGGGAGGTVLLSAVAGLSGLTVTANGGTGGDAVSGHGVGGGGGGGAILMTASVPSAPVGGAAGTGGNAGTSGSSGTAATVTSSAIPGQVLGVGCQPVLTATKTTATAGVWKGTSQTASYSITVSNLTGRPTATSVTISDSLPTGFSYASTSSPVLSGGATRPSGTDPTASSATPTWTGFSIPGGGSVAITFIVNAPAVNGTYQNPVLASGTSVAGSVAVQYDSASSSGEDVTIADATMTAIPFGMDDRSMVPTNTTDAAPSGSTTKTVNTYWPATASAAAGATTITLGTPGGASAGLNGGDLVLVAQMQDGSINGNNSTSYGDGSTGSGAVSIAEAGRYEYAVVTTGSITAGSGGTLNVRGAGPNGGLINAYVNAAATGSAGQKKFQVVRVPVYPSFTMPSNIVPLDWDGSKGGIVAFDVIGTLTMGSKVIDATGSGFRGGGTVQRTTITEGPYVELLAAGTSAPKGEGIAGVPYYVYDGSATSNLGAEGYPNGSFGRGAPANAGGGGSVDGGGGGGAGAGASGGTGGNTTAAGSRSGGLGGTAPATGTQRLTMGGGGGAGGENTGASNFWAGGRGGGLALIRATVAVSGTGTIQANGDAGLGANNTDGGGGGGGGGAVLVSAPTVASTVTLNATGGNGGTTNSTRGNGGGGGGGLVVVSGVPTTVSVAGGVGTGGTGNVGASGGTGSVISDRMLDTLMPAARVSRYPIGPSTLAAADGLDRVTAATSSSFSLSNYVDLDLDAAVPSGTAAVPLSDQQLLLTFANDSVAGTAAVYGQVIDTSSSTVLATFGSSGTPAASVTGMEAVSFSITGLSGVSSATYLSTLRVRLFVRSSDSSGLRLDRVAFLATAQGTRFKLVPVAIDDRASGSSTTSTNLLRTQESSSAGSWIPAGFVPSPSFDSTRYYGFQLDRPLPAGATLSSSSLAVRLKGENSTATYCGYIEWWGRSPAVLVASNYSSSSPLCGSYAAFADLTLTGPSATAADLENLTVKFFMKSSTASTRMFFDSVTLTATWQPGTGGTRYRNAVLATPDLAGYWRLGETSGSTATDIGTPANRAGTYSNVTLNQTGALSGDSDKSALFNGTTSLVDAGDTLDFSGRRPFTVSCWFKADATSVETYPKFAGKASSTPDGWDIEWSKDYQAVILERWVAGTNVGPWTGEGSAPAGTWFHTVGTYDGTTTSVYLNGVLLGSTTDTRSTIDTNSTFQIGATLGFFKGNIDDVAVWSRALTATEIATLYAAGT